MDAQTTSVFCCTACGVSAEARCTCAVPYDYFTLTQQIELRQRKAAQLYENGMTMQQIADRLKVDRSTIGADLNLGNIPKSKRPKTARNPRGAGRPRGRKTKPPGVKQAQRSIDVTPETWEEVKLRAAKAEMPVAQLIGQLLTSTTEVDPATLSMTAQEKLAAAIRQADKKRTNEFERLVQAEVTKRNQAAFPRLQEAQDKAYQTERTYRQFMEKQKKLGTMRDWNNLMMCLHPDTRRATSDEKFDEAFRWVQTKKFAITGEK
jgi:hypothetical protein